MIAFEDLTFLFRCGIENRGIVRLDFDEAALLYKYVKKCKGNVLEIGRFYGGSSILMAAALGDNQLVYTIDIVDSEASRRNINTFSDKDKIKVITAYSQNIVKSWTEKLSLIFVDGGHSVPVRSEDSIQWSPFVELNGYMVFHDVRASGKYLKLEPILGDMINSKKWIEVAAVGSMVVLQRKAI